MYRYRWIYGNPNLSNRLTSESAQTQRKCMGKIPLTLSTPCHTLKYTVWLASKRRKHGAPRCLRAHRSTVDHRGARPLAPHARPPWHSESVWKHKI